MSESRALERECGTLSRYLVGAPAPALCVEAYLRAHAGAADGGPGFGVQPLAADGPPTPTPRPALIDRWTVALGRRGGAATRLVDAYCALFRRGGPLRRKLTLVLAVLEHAPPHHVALHAGSGTGPARAWIGLTWTGLLFALSLAAGVVVCGPVHLASALFSGGRSDG